MRAVFLLIFVSLFLICNAQAAEETIPTELPLWGIGKPGAKNVVRFIWSSRCEGCQQAFAKEIAPIFRRSHDQRDNIQVLLIEKDNPDIIVPLVCGGRFYYRSIVRDFLTSEKSIQEIVDAHQHEGDKIDACVDRVKSRILITYFEKRLNALMGDNPLPMLSLNGKNVSTLGTK